MHDGQYMLVGEFVAVVVFLFAPPLLLAFLIQTTLFVKRRLFRRGFVGRAITSYIATVFGSLVIGVAIHQIVPESLGPLLRVREVVIGSQPWLVMPLAFVAVAVAAIVSTWWTLGRTHSDA